MPYIFFLLTSVIWGASFILMKKATLSFDALSIGAIRVIGGAAILAIAYKISRQPWPFKKKHLGPIAFVTVFAGVYPYTMQPFLISKHDSGFIGMMVCLVPLYTIIVSIPILKIYPTKRQLLGVIGGLICFSAIIADGAIRNIPALDMLLAMSVPLAYATGNTSIKRTLHDIPPIPLTLITLLGSSSILVPLALATETTHNPETLPLALTSALTLGVFGTGIAIYLFYNLVVNQGPLFASLVTYLVPLGAIAWGWFDGEHPTLMQLFAVIGVVFMVTIVIYGAAHPTPQPATATATAKIDD